MIGAYEKTTYLPSSRRAASVKPMRPRLPKNNWAAPGTRYEDGSVRGYPFPTLNTRAARIKRKGLLG